jgi:hypothetical protein
MATSAEKLTGFPEISSTQSRILEAIVCRGFCVSEFQKQDFATEKWGLTLETMALPERQSGCRFSPNGLLISR